MLDNENNGRQGPDVTPPPDDQSLDRGFGGLPGQQPGDDSDDGVSDAPPIDKSMRRPIETPPDRTKH